MRITIDVTSRCRTILRHVGVAIAGALMFIACVGPASDRGCREFNGRLCSAPHLDSSGLLVASAPVGSANMQLRLQRAAVKILEDGEPVGSGSYVSSGGLVLTSAEHVRRTLAKRRDQWSLVVSGFAASERDLEIGLPRISVRDARRDDGIYSEHDDVRLVFLSDGGAGRSLESCLRRVPMWDPGGVAILRVYRGGVPVDVGDAYLSVSGVSDAGQGDPVACAAFPRAPLRSVPSSDLELRRDVILPLLKQRIEHLVAAVRERGEVPWPLKATSQDAFDDIDWKLSALNQGNVIELRRMLERWVVSRIPEPEERARACECLEEMRRVAASLRVLLMRDHFQDVFFLGSVLRGLLVAEALDASLTLEEREVARLSAMSMELSRNRLAPSLLRSAASSAAKWLSAGDPTAELLLKAQVEDGGYGLFARGVMSNDALILLFLEDQEGRTKWAECEDPSVVFARDLYILRASTSAQLRVAENVWGKLKREWSHYLVDNEALGGGVAADGTLRMACGAIVDVDAAMDAGDMVMQLDVCDGSYGACVCSESGRVVAVVIGENDAGRNDDIVFTGDGSLCFGVSTGRLKAELLGMPGGEAIHKEVFGRHD